MKYSTYTNVLCLLLLTHLSGCGAGDMPNVPHADEADDSADPDSADALRADANDHMFDHVLEPPKEYYDALVQERMRNFGGESFGLTGANEAHVLYLNFNGANVVKGYRRGESFIPCSSRSRIPASGYTPGEQDQITSLVQDYFDQAMALIHVVNTQPESGNYTTIIVGGTYRDLGCGGGSNILGIAPLDRGNNNKNDIGFAFVRSGHSNFTAATTIAHEAAHSFGLDHISDTTAVMNPAVVRTITGFKEGRIVGRAGRQNGPLLLQKNLGVLDPNMPRPEPTPPSQPIPEPNNPTIPNNPLPPVIPQPPIGNIPELPGLDILSNLGKLLGGANPGQIPFDLNQLMSSIGSLIPGGLGNTSSIGGLPEIDKLLSTILASAAAGSATKGGLGSSSSVNSLLSGMLSGNQLANLGVSDFSSLLALINQNSGSNPSSGAGSAGSFLGGLLRGLFGGVSPIPLPTPNQPSTPVPPAINELPDFAGLLGLQRFSRVEDVTWAMDQHAYAVSANYTGAERDALLTFLKLAYLQRLQSLNF